MRIKHLFLFGLIFLVTACQKESTLNTIPKTGPETSYDVKTVGPEDIPRVIHYLKSELGNNNTRSLKGYKLNLPFNENQIIQERINQVEDPETANTTYTFAVKKKKNENWVYNLIITENPDGSFKNISLLQFVFTDSFNNDYNDKLVSLEDFEGEIVHYFVYSKEVEDKGIHDLEPCGYYEHHDPIDDDPTSPGCNNCGGSTTPSGDGSVGGGTYKCTYSVTHIDFEGACDDCASGIGKTTIVVKFWNCGYTQGENFSGFDHCEDPNPIEPNDPGIDLPYHQEVINNWKQTVSTNSFQQYDINALAKNAQFQSLVAQYFPKPSSSISDQQWGEISAKVYKGAYNSLSSSADQHTKAMNLLCEWNWWEEIKAAGKAIQDAYQASSAYLPQNSAEWGDMAFAFGHFIPEILLEFNPVAAAIVSLKDAWTYFDEGKYVVGGIYVAAAIAEFVPWAQVFNKIADVGKIGIKAFKYFKSVKILKVAPEFLLNLDALKYADKLKSKAVLKSDGYTSFSGITTKWKKDFPETINANGTTKVFRHHAIEQQVLDKYPGLISLEEMHSISNLRGIPNELNNSMHLSNQFLHGKGIRGEWKEFYDKFEDLGRFPTKQELLDKATDIDNKLGDLFYPPIRD